MVFLQETHFPKRYAPSFLHAHFPVFYLSKAENKTKGVAVLFSKFCNFDLIKEYADPEGRFVLVKGTLEGNLYTFVSYYAPNRGQKGFFYQMFDVLQPFMEGIIIMGGDSNLAFDSGLDKSKQHNAKMIRPTKASTQVARMLHQSSLTDIWKELNPKTKDFTHFSNPHQSYSRIDHILLSNRHVPSAIKSTIVDVSWSDHSMVLLSLRKENSTQRVSHWTLNQSILKDPVLVAEIKQAIK